MADTYTLHIAGLTRELPICKVNDHMDIAAFIMFSDVELTEACAAALLKKAPEFDVILTAEAKGIPLAYEMARQSGKYWIPARKGPKLYMREPVIIEDQSITTAGKQTLVIDKKDIEYMDGIFGMPGAIMDKTPQRQRHPGTGCAVRSCVVSGVYPCMGAARQGTGRADRDLHGSGGDGRRCFLQRKPPARYAAAD